MADPLKVLHSLQRLDTTYTVFEPDQVLTHHQLNSLSGYLDDQDRLSRVNLLGVGLVGGLQVRLAGGQVQLTRGLGVSTDGDLLMLPADTSYDRFRPYGISAPAYTPFYGRRGDGTEDTLLYELAELVPVGESDVLAQPLSRLSALAERVVLLLMETVVDDPDLCSGTDCDNLGRNALHRQRVLLMQPADVLHLLGRLPSLQTLGNRARALPELFADRPALGTDITSVATLALRYLGSLHSGDPRVPRTLQRLQAGFAQLSRALPDELREQFGADPTADWSARLDAHLAAARRSSAVPLALFNHGKDLCEAFNVMRESYLACDAVLLPDVAAFPKHLLLGQLNAPREHRTGLFPAPLDGPSREAAAQARFGLWKLHSLIDAFALPTDTTLRITPSAGEAQSLQMRAIPWHYTVRGRVPVHVAWNYRRASSGRSQENSGYRAADWLASGRARDPLAYGVAAHDFFRIEGHLGQPVEAVDAALKREIAAHNLPIEVQSVLLHGNRRGGIRIKPGIRYTTLHRLHHLVRKDVAIKLEEGSDFGQQYAKDVSEAVNAGRILPTQADGLTAVAQAETARDAVRATQVAAAPAMAQVRYSAYRADTTWKSGYAASLQKVGDARLSLSHVSRNDLASPFDSLLATTKPLWINWLDDLIVAGDERADDRLVFSAFVKRHPGLDHLGGCWRGGTFVLVYDEGGRIVADFTLPYPCAEIDEPEPEEPPLVKPPDLRPPKWLDRAVRVIPSLDFEIGTRFVDVRKTFVADLDKQSANIEGLVKGIGFVRTTTTPDLKGSLGELFTGDALLDRMAADVARKRDYVEDLRSGIGANAFEGESLEEARQRLKAGEEDLARSVTQATERAVKVNVDTTSSGGVALAAVMNSGVIAVRDTAVVEQLGTQLGSVNNNATGNVGRLITGMVNAGGLRLRR
ncbi:MAG: hypothetical protein Q8M96_17775 [Rubrivivax sp.]|nr:hypothetical protein [Rubrivivax sp.]